MHIQLQHMDPAAGLCGHVKTHPWKAGLLQVSNRESVHVYEGVHILPSAASLCVMAAGLDLCVCVQQYVQQYVSCAGFI
jgi:hypothetical protein